MSADDAPDPDRLADEQSALERVAMLVARGVPRDETFDAVATEVHRLLRAHVTVLVRFDPDGLVTVIATCGHETDALGVGVCWHPIAASASLAGVLSGRPAAVSRQRPLPAGADERLADFSDVEDALNELRDISRHEVLSLGRWC